MSTDERLAAALSLLANRDRRVAIEFLARGTPRPVTVDDVARHVEGESPEADGRAGLRRIAVELHHSHLPRLDEYGLVEFDANAGVVVYRSDDLVESLLKRSVVESGREQP